MLGICVWVATLGTDGRLFGAIAAGLLAVALIVSICEQQRQQKERRRKR